MFHNPIDGDSGLLPPGLSLDLSMAIVLAAPVSIALWAALIALWSLIS